MNRRIKLFFILVFFFIIKINPVYCGAGVNIPFKGIYVASKWIKPIDAYVLENKTVDGVHLRLRWNTLEPENNKYDWTFLDSELKRISAIGKKISIGIAAGKHTPEWVYDAGVPGLTFEEFRKQGKAQKFSAKIPVPWDSKYLEYWTGFIKDFAEHLKSMPEIYKNITLIKLTGINETTLELRLPAQKEIENERGKSTNAPALWRSVGYRPQLIVETWIKILDTFNNNFTDKNFSLEIISAKAFPALDESGNETANNDAEILMQTLIENAHEKFKEKLAIQWDALQNKTQIPPILQWCEKFNVPFGYQVAESEYGNPDCLQNNTPCDEDEFKSLFDKVESGKVVFIEIFSKTTLAFPRALAYGHQKLNR
jgi:hypothetical protein